MEDIIAVAVSSFFSCRLISISLAINPSSYRAARALIIALGSPVYVGIYDEQGALVESIKHDGLGSDVLPLIFADMLNRYRFKRLIYANGPGSFMGIKVAYLFLKTLSIVRNIPLLAVDGFFFNENRCFLGS